MIRSFELIDGFAAVIGDLVASRRRERREDLHETLRSALSTANAHTEALQPLIPTIGDEFQGVYATLALALRATLLVQLSMVGVSDVRFGVGWGHIVVLEEERGGLGQDGPAWWAAREAVDRLKALGRRAPRGWRTLLRVYADRDETGPPGRDAAFRGHRPGMLSAGAEPLINAALVFRDELVARMDDRDARIALGLLFGGTATGIAAEEGISQSAVSQRAVRSGAYALLETNAMLDRALGEEP